MDGLRAISVFAVVSNHLSTQSLPGFAHFIHGWVGVQIFFVLSGFLITSLLIREEQIRGTVSLKAFYLRRAFRILPMYFATLGLYFIVCLSPMGSEKLPQFIAGLPYFLTFLNEYTPPAAGTIFGQGWSLGIEEKFYLVFPFVFFVMTRRWLLRAILLVFALLLSGLLPYFYAHCYFALAVGCLLAFATGFPKVRQAFAQVPTWAAVALVLLGYVLLHIEPSNRRVFVVMVALLVGSVITRASFSRRLLSSEPLVWLGKRSYSIYLLHVLALNGVRLVVPDTGAVGYLTEWIAGFTVAAIASHAAYSLIERPALVWGRRFTERRFPLAPSPQVPREMAAQSGSVGI